MDMKDKEPKLSTRDFLKVAGASTLALFLGSCVKKIEAITSAPATSDGGTLTPFPTEISPSETPAEATATSEIAWARPMVSVEQAKSVIPATPVSLDENGNLVGLEGKDETLRTDVRDRCLALLSAKEQNFSLTEGEMADNRVTREDFTGGRVYFSQDAVSGHWILYFRLANGDIMHQVVSYGGGGMQWADYPASYDASVRVTGNYLPLAVPSAEVGVVWLYSPDGKVVIPQFVASPKTLVDGETVFTQALRYGYAYEPATWVEIPGLEALSFSTPEQVFVPEGFQIGALGLLQNPETGRNVLTMNPEADWQRLREGIIGGLWQANVDYAKYIGLSTDATKYSKENFIKAALEGKTLKIGIPVRDRPDWDNWGDRDDPHSYYNVIYKKYRQSLLRLKTVNVRLDNIQLQVLDPVHFSKFMGGRDWLDLEQEAISQGLMPSDKGNGAIAFTVSDNGELVITTGSYDFRDIPIPDNPNLTIGRFDDSLHDKYPNFFREDGLGNTADKAASYCIGVITDWLNYLPAAEKKTYYGEMKNGIAYKYILVPLALPDDIRENVDKWYTNPPPFVFTR